MDKKQSGWYSLSSLIAKRKRSEQAAGVSESFLALVEALNIAVEVFTSHSEKKFEDVLSHGLRAIADAARVQRIAVYQLLKGHKRLGQTYVWAHGETVTLDNELIELPDNPPIVRWVNTLSKGECINGRVDEMTEEEKVFLASFKVRSIFIVPVFTHNEFWGFVTLEDQINYRYFNEDCFNLLCSAARLCANAFIRREMTQSADKAVEALKRREHLVDALNKMAVTFLSKSNEAFGDIMAAGIQNIADAIGLDRMSIWRNFSMPDGLHTSQIYRWERAAGGTTQSKPELLDVTFSILVPEWEKLLENGGTRNGPVEDTPEAAVLQSFGIVSIFTTPIFINHTFWGLALFEDIRNKRYFEDDATETMRSAAFLCANAVLREEMERRIVEANEFSRTLLDAAPTGFTIINENLNVLDCNDTILHIFETTKEDLFNNFEKFSPEFQSDGQRSDEKAAAVIRRALNGEKLTYEWTHCSSSGKPIPFEITLTRTRYNGKPAALGYQYDLRNIKKMEREIAEAEELANAIKEASPIAYVLFDEDMHVIDCNDAAVRLLDCPDKQILLEHYWDAFQPEAQPDGNTSYQKAVSKRDEVTVEGDGKATFEWVHRSYNGELIPMDNTLTRITYRGKKYVISFKYDLRNTRKMMESIREQSELLKIRLEQQELISEISKGFISSGDSETYVQEAIAKLGRYHKVSEVFIFSIDYERSDTALAYHWSSDGILPRMVDFDLFSIIKSSFPERLPDCATVPVIACPDIAASKVDAFQPLLSVDVAAFICAPLYVEGRLWGIISVEQCFKPHLWTENEKSFVAMTASTIAGVIMRNIYNAMLKEALYKATEASKAKGEFLSNMSHEMRTPLNAIIGMTSIGKKALDMAHKDYALDKIDNASAHLLGVINDVLDMSKIEANMLELSPDEFNFEKMLQKVVAVVNFRVDEKKQKFKVNIDRAIPKNLIGDDQRLAQVITNLLGNAIKFTPEKGSITLDTRFLGEEDNICTIQISVIDTGIGISKEHQSKLFRSFQQAETSTTRKFGGTGLGLAISKSIVELMGGNIWVESKPGNGSTFAFTIRIKRGTEKKQGLLAPNVNLRNLRILVVDDDPDILGYMGEVLQGFGTSCDTAASGEEALKIIEQNGSYNIYFVDWKMPGIDGIQLTSKIKTQKSGKDNVVVIIISAAEWSNIEAEARKAGVDKFMSKPLFPSAIADIISECLGLNHGQDAEKSPDLVDSFEGRQILLVEDVEINREIVITLLEPTLLKIDCAENGAEAVCLFKKAPEKYDMIFMDVQMPEMDGYEATRCIRDLETEKAKSIPIIAMTANVFKEDIEKSLAAGMNDHIGKPLDFEIVLEKLRHYLPKG